MSTATVSRALSARGYVEAGLAARIMSAAAELNYPMPTSLAGQTVWLAASAPAMLDFARNQFTLHVLEGLRDRAATLGMAVEARSLPDRDVAAGLLADAAADPGVAGVLLLSIDDDATLAEARAAPVPVALVNADDPEMQLSSVAPCNRSAAALATDALRQLGHQRILLLTHPGRRTIQRRLEGWRDAMGGDADPDLVVEVGDWLAEAAAAAIASRLERGRDFTAILACGDALAVGAYAALRGAGVAIPGEVSVLSIDGLPQAALLDPPLSTMEIPMRAVGAVALDLLKEARSRGLPPRRVELACELVLRGSTGPVAAF
ncbi:LacI family DNA-binding transcriptional regulator [Paracoccus suum]|uniref:LacI family DNA-binding transcriptional regulator n=1 Tax=Paracoccus suum TaxID=2259340 RepID=UPI0018EFD021|nr:LacI family DNA-binding transcriptional regulator [Paracoccus suum]